MQKLVEWIVEEKMPRAAIRVSESNTIRAMRHIRRNHMFNGKPGKSLFSAGDMTQVWAMIQETLDNPDAVKAMRANRDRKVYKKSFATPVGIHGRTGALCFTVTVSYNSRNDCVVTAFPSV